MDWLNDYVRHENVERIVVGEPRQTNGQPSPVSWVDERFTSVMAHQAMLDGGLKKKDRQNKALVDEISATIILQSFLESRRIK